MKDWNTTMLDAYEVEQAQNEHRMAWAMEQAKNYYRDNPREFFNQLDADDIIKVLYEVAGMADGLCMAFAHVELPSVIQSVLEEKAQEYFNDSL